MNISTIEQGEELLKKLPEFPLDSRDDLPNSTDYREAISWLWNHASELLQCAREVEENKAVDKAVDRVVNKYGDAMRNLANR